MSDQSSITDKTVCQALLSIARAANAVLDDDGPDNVREDWREVACRIVGRHDDHTWRYWGFLRQEVADLDELRADPEIRDDRKTTQDFEDEIDASLWMLLHPAEAPCWGCQNQIGWREGPVDVPGAPFWQPLRSCTTHPVQSVVRDPWQQVA